MIPMDNNNEQKTINALYVLLIVASIMGCMPFVSAVFLSLALTMIVLIAGYIYKARSDKDSLLWNHMTYLVGTIWIGSTFLFIGVAIAGIWVFLQGDHSIIHNAAMEMAGGRVPTDVDMINLSMNYIEANKMLLITASLAFVGPALLYFVYRIANGFTRSLKGYRMANPKGWL